MDFAKKSGRLFAFPYAVVCHAERPLGENAEQDYKADGLVSGVEIWVLEYVLGALYVSMKDKMECVLCFA